MNNLHLHVTSSHRWKCLSPTPRGLCLKYLCNELLKITVDSPYKNTVGTGRCILIENRVTFCDYLGSDGLAALR